MKKQLINLNPIKEAIKAKLLEQYDATVYMNTNKIEVSVNVDDILNEYMQQRNITEPSVFITPNAYIKMRMLVEKSDKEVGWYGIVNQMPGLDATYLIEDIIVYPQKVTGATVEQDEERMFNFEMSLTTEQVNHKRFHGHSHVNMTTTPSGVDENFYQDLLTQVTDYYIITITNKRGEYTTRFYDMQHNILYTDVPIQLIQDSGVAYLDWYEEQSKEIKAATIVSKMPPQNTGYYKSEQTSLFDNTPIYDPYLKDWITADEYEDVYGAPYNGEFNFMKKGKGNKKWKKHI